VQHKLYKVVCNYICVGPIVWYQKFEYALGHWLQKATEHVIGCVLCSPGCFSLFRGEALMDDSVMNKYTTKPTEAKHYVQYDQGKTAQHLSLQDFSINVSSN
jgi:cellulose synthase/poly-beta-1,6-N-acetylglucosamine synthase-like glycosyltransferase